MQSQVSHSENRRPCVINIHDDTEVYRWSKIFGVDPEILRRAARSTHTSSLEVLERYLEINKQHLINAANHQNPDK